MSQTGADRGVFVQVTQSGKLTYRVIYKFQREELSGERARGRAVLGRQEKSEELGVVQGSGAGAKETFRRGIAGRRGGSGIRPGSSKRKDGLGLGHGLFLKMVGGWARWPSGRSGGSPHPRSLRSLLARDREDRSESSEGRRDDERATASLSSNARSASSSA